MEINEVSGKIDREVMKLGRKNDKQNVFLETQYNQLLQAQITIDNQVRTITSSMADWDRKIHKLDNKIQEVDAVADKLDK